MTESVLNHQERQQLIESLTREVDQLERICDQELKQLLAHLVASRFERTAMTLPQKRNLINQLFATMRGLDVLQSYLDDPAVTEVMVNGPGQVFIERDGKLFKTGTRFDDKVHLEHVISRFFGRANRLINEQNPINGMRLRDGSRVHAVLPPAAPDGPMLCIRRFTGVLPDLAALVDNRTLSDEAASYLKDAVRAKRNIFISGGTGTGKTTFLNALSAYIGSDERVVTIEDAMELDLQNIANLVRLEARDAGPDNQGEISQKDLIRSSLRLRPDRILVGEIRGAEAFEMVQAMSTGHPGSMSTGHGNNSLEMLDRICLMILMASNLPWQAIRRLVATALDLNIHLIRLPDGKRAVSEIVRIEDYREECFLLQTIFSRKGGRLQCCV